MAAELFAVDALGPRGPFHAAKRSTLSTVAGEPAAELSLVPPLFTDRALTALRRATPLPAAAREAALARAGDLFTHGTVAGLSPGAYDELVARVGGVPASVVETARHNIGDRVADAPRSVAQARPAGAVDDWRDQRTRSGCALWQRHGEVFAVQSAGNHPGTHSLWPEALALGYRVAIRPSSREPFTPHRLCAALVEAGFGTDHVALLPSEHSGVDALLRGADRAMVYGGEDVVARYDGVASVLTQGPGRSKVLLTADVDWRQHLDTVVASVAGHGGTGCVNTTAVFVEGDPAPVAAALAERLGALPSLPPQDEKAVLPVQPAAFAGTLAQYVQDKARGSTAWLGGDGVAEELGDGSAVLRPAVHQVDRPDAPQIRIELPFPCVWVAPWSPDAGTAPLRDTLVLTAFTDDEHLVDRLFAEPTISNVFLGDHPTHWIAAGVPHDDYLASFLMRSKAVIRG
jgi:acyl-CoA reductase-like NAD-dependent aldehyde dehydrogenase